MSTPTPYTRTVYLAEGHREAPDPSRLFRPLADLACDGYYTPSDLMHDAVYLAGNVTGECVFYWGAREGGGTAIGADRAMVDQPGATGKVYRVTVTHEERGHWNATIEEVDATGSA